MTRARLWAGRGWNWPHLPWTWPDRTCESPWRATHCLARTGRYLNTWEAAATTATPCERRIKMHSVYTSLFQWEPKPTCCPSGRARPESTARPRSPKRGDSTPDQRHWWGRPGRRPAAGIAATGCCWPRRTAFRPNLAGTTPTLKMQFQKLRKFVFTIEILDCVPH